MQVVVLCLSLEVLIINHYEILKYVVYFNFYCPTNSLIIPVKHSAKLATATALFLSNVPVSPVVQCSKHTVPLAYCLNYLEKKF